MQTFLIAVNPNNLAQHFISHQSHYINPRNSLHVSVPSLDLFKTSIPFAEASLVQLSASKYDVLYFSFWFQTYDVLYFSFWFQT